MTDPSFAFYTEHGGINSEAEFTRLLSGATAAVDAAIWPNVVTDATRDAYLRAICAAIDADPDGLLAESHGKTQYSYASANVQGMAGLSAHPIGRAIVKHLTGTGLLYRGI
ncbi:MAG: head-tail connector protein [Coriobacteriia bacterium]